MTKKRYAEVVVGLPIEGPFDYAIPENLFKQIKIGMRVWVPFRNRRLVGYVVGFLDRPRIKRIKQIISHLDREVIISPRMLRLTRWIANYYFCSWGEAIEATIPRTLKRGKRLS
jgi:primosomal protein N' (replication factor Y)